MSVEFESGRLLEGRAWILADNFASLNHRCALIFIGTAR